MDTDVQSDRVFQKEGESWPRRVAKEGVKGSKGGLIGQDKCSVCIMRTVFDRSMTHDSISPHLVME